MNGEPKSQTRRGALASIVRAAFPAMLAAVAMNSASAQMSFSIDYQGPPIGAPDSCTGAVGLTEGDILVAFTITPAPGPLPPPCILIPGGAPGLGLPLYPGAVGHVPGVPGFVEVDALSYGVEPALRPAGPQQYTWSFSVDEFAFGIGVPPIPSVFTEGAIGATEAAADIFIVNTVGAGPFCGVSPVGNVDVVDGDGLFPFGGPGLGLAEPIPPVAGLPDAGANLDALDADTLNALLPGGPVYFSLDSGVPDIAEGVPNTASALANGLGVGGDVLVTPAPGAAPIVFAPALLLGLDLFGPDTDDLDALILWENGTGVYEPSVTPYDWLTGATDMLMFSVRRGSAVIGAPDSICGLPIEPGDILVPPTVAGGFPGIWIPAEALGLATRRSNFNNADDLNALDVLCSVPGDVDGDGDVDLTDLAILLANFGCVGTCAGDVNGDGVVDLTDLAILLSSFGATC
ncbi:MAG: hypothetical protein D6744_15715 [Planctomycetota bacterium]|nr:MAG: hypothetical protein D6744_15715 [Planctomycetota bacterium]